VDEFVKYLVVAFSALLPLVNPPASALEFLGVVGIGSAESYKVLARKIAVNTTLFLAAVVLSGPYVLQFFGISVEILQCVGGAILVAMGWQLLNKPEGIRDARDPRVEEAAQDCVATYWTSQAFYPLTFPITVGPGSVAVTLTLSAQIKSLQIHHRISAFAGLMMCIALLSFMVYIFYAYAPSAAKKFPAPVVNGGMRIIAFLLMCIGAQITWHGLHSLLLAARP
jgi:multiple antibiotic resistance protein